MLTSTNSVNHNYAFPDPPLTEKGFSDARQIRLPKTPDLIIISPMTRTVQTAIQAFEDLISGPNPTAKVQIWPDLREAHYKICNRGIARQELVAKFPDFDFSECHEQWDYPPHAIEGAVIRAREVREKLRKLATKHNHILLITHRAFIAFLVQGERFKTCGVLLPLHSKMKHANLT